MESAVGFQRACGAEDRLPLGGINCPADIGHTRQENVILDVENPCGLVRPLEEFPKADEFISLVTDKGRGCKSLMVLLWTDRQRIFSMPKRFA